MAARRVVVKLGTSVVGGQDERLERLTAALAALKHANRQVVLVSSGAVGLGASRLNLSRARLEDVTTRQACAAVGQSLLMHVYERLFRAHDVIPAQILLTESDFKDHRRYLNLRCTLEKLLKLGVLPIVNENDTISTAELEYLPTDGATRARIFSDNDRLAALVMSKLDAEALVLLTDVDGLYANHAAKDKTVISFIGRITPEIKQLAAGPSATGRGGMLTKLEAAEIAMRAGGAAVIANGTATDVIGRIFAGERVGTIFMSDARLTGRKRWLAYAAGVRARIIVNEGAREAILRGKASLLTSGVVRVESPFEPQDVLAIADTEGHEFARGIANFTSREAQERTKGRVLVTRDNIVVLENQKAS